MCAEGRRGEKATFVSILCQYVHVYRHHTSCDLIGVHCRYNRKGVLLRCVISFSSHSMESIGVCVCVWCVVAHISWLQINYMIVCMHLYVRISMWMFECVNTVEEQDPLRSSILLTATDASRYVLLLLVCMDVWMDVCMYICECQMPGVHVEHSTHNVHSANDKTWSEQHRMDVWMDGWMHVYMHMWLCLCGCPCVYRIPYFYFFISLIISI